MKFLFPISLISAAMSLLAILGFSATAYVPGPNVEKERAWEMVITGVFFLVWLGIAFWARPRKPAVAKTRPPKWLSRALAGVGVIYLLAIFLATFG